MTDLSTLTLGVPQAATATLAVLLVVPLAFLARPSRATLLWTLSLLTTAAGVYVELSAELGGVEWLRRAGLGLTLAAVPLLWSGVRAWRGVAAYVWVAPVLGLGGCCALALLPDAAYASGFRIAFFVAGVFAGFVAVELRRISERGAAAVIPLVVLSTLFAALGLLVLAGGLLAPAAGGDFALVRATTSIGVIVYLVCALLAIVTLAQGAGTAPRRDGDEVLRRMQERLRRAHRRGEPNWAVLAIRLDDRHELAEAYGRERFLHLVAHFDDAVERTLPADADIGGHGTGLLHVLIDRTETVLQQHIGRVLDAVADDTDPRGLVRLSASIGWVPVGRGDADAAELVARAQAAAEQAARGGGNRLVRATD